MSFSITNRFTKQYSKKEIDDQKKVDDTLDLLDINPKHPGLHAHRVQGTKKIWECYVDDSMRVTFEYGKNCIILRNNCHHGITSRDS
jgi:hypothetical protein